MEKLSNYYDTKSFIKFIIVGIANTMIGYGCFVIGYDLTKLIFFSLVMQTIFGVLNSFIWNGKWTFRRNQSNFRLVIFVKFCLLYIVLSLANLLYLKYISIYKIKIIYAQIPAILLTVLIGYLIQKMWIYKA